MNICKDLSRSVLDSRKKEMDVPDRVERLADLGKRLSGEVAFSGATS